MASRTTFAETAHSLLRDGLLDAAGELLVDHTWSEISMAAIAQQAGVSRQTLYNEFGSRDVFAQTFALREADRFLTSLEPVIAEHSDSPRAALAAAFEAFLTAAEDNPMVRAIVVREPGADDLFSLFTTRGGPVVEYATERLSAAFIENWPDADRDGARLAAEAFTRLAISHAGLPLASPEAAAEQTAAVMGPFLDQVFGS